MNLGSWFMIFIDKIDVFIYILCKNIELSKNLIL